MLPAILSKPDHASRLRLKLSEYAILYIPWGRTNIIISLLSVDQQDSVFGSHLVRHEAPMRSSSFLLRHFKTLGEGIRKYTSPPFEAVNTHIPNPVYRPWTRHSHLSSNLPLITINCEFCGEALEAATADFSMLCIPVSVSQDAVDHEVVISFSMNSM